MGICDYHIPAAANDRHLLDHDVGCGLSKYGKHVSLYAVGAFPRIGVANGNTAIMMGF